VSKPSLVVVLAEDQRHQSFVRRYLYRLGHSYHEVRVEPPSNGRGCGEQWVRERYAKAVEAYRLRSARTALVVAIDADKGSVDERARQLREALTQAHLPLRAADERISHLIPKRNVETWILCLNGENVDEDTDYSRAPGIDEQIKAAAETFYEWTRKNATVPGHCVPSVQSAIPEARRLD
jgi:hypothetical protein